MLALLDDKGTYKKINNNLTKKIPTINNKLVKSWLVGGYISIEEKSRLTYLYRFNSSNLWIPQNTQTQQPTLAYSICDSNLCLLLGD